MCSLAWNTRGLQQSGETHEKKYPSALLVKFFFYVPVSMLSLTKSGLTFPEQSIPTLRWILWQREQPLETELQSLARIHPSHLKEKCKWASVQKAEKKKKLCFWRLTRAKQLWQENYIKTQVVALRCCCSQCEPISSRLQTSGYELKCFFDFQCSAIGAAETLPALSAVSHWKEWVRNTAFQWTCNTLMLNGKKNTKKNNFENS